MRSEKSGEGAAVVGGAAPSPFLGAHAFEEEDRSLFFGRERAVRDLGHLLIAERIVLLYSPSGAGKTSLLQAGLIPSLQDEGFVVLPPMRVNLEPGGDVSNRFVHSALRYLHDGLPRSRLPAEGADTSFQESDEILQPAAEVVDTASRERDEIARPEVDDAGLRSMQLGEYLDRLVEAQGAGERGQQVDAGLAESRDDDEQGQRRDYDYVLVLDQFEEILKIEPGSRAAHEARLEFFRQLGEVLANRRRWAVFSLREDYLAGLDRYRWAIPTRLGNHYRLDLLRVEDARRAIAMPPRRNSVEFTDAAVAHLLNDLGRGGSATPTSTSETERLADAMYIEPLHLQVVCERIWRDVAPKPGDRITEDQIGPHADVDTALRRFYDDEVARIAGAHAALADEQTIRDWFQDELIIGDPGARGQVPRGEVTSGGLNNSVADALITARLVNRETRLKSDWYELSHDRLIEPVRASNAEWFQRHLTPLQRRARRWTRTGRPNEELLAPWDWVRAWIWVSRSGHRLRDHERQYLHRSRQVFLRWAAFAGVLVVAAIAVLLIMRWLDEEKAERRSELWASYAAGWLPTAEESLDRSLLLAVAAVDEADGNPPIDARTSLLSSLLFWPAFVMPLPDGDAGAVGTPAVTAPGDGSALSGAITVDRQGRYVAAANANGGVDVVELSSWPVSVGMTDVPDSYRLPIDGSANPVVDVAFMPDVGLLAVGRLDGTIELWDVSTSQRAGSTDTGGPAQPSLRLTSLSVRETSLAAGYNNGSVIVWEVSEGGATEERQTLRRERYRGGVVSLAFDPTDDDGRIVAGYEDGAVWSWRIADTPGRAIHTLPGRAPVTSITVSEESGMVVVGWKGGIVVLRKVGSESADPEWSELGDPAKDQVTTTDQVTNVEFMPGNPQVFLSSHANGEIIRWTLGSQQNTLGGLAPRVVQGASPQSISDFAFLPDGRWFVSAQPGGRGLALWNAFGLPIIASVECDGTVSAATASTACGTISSGQVATAAPLTITSPLLESPAIAGMLPAPPVSVASPIPEGPVGIASPVAAPSPDVVVPTVETSFESEIVVVDDELGMRATGLEDGTVVLEVMADGEGSEIGRLAGHGEAVRGLEFVPVDNQLRSTYESGLVIVWDLDIDLWKRYACVRAGRPLDADDEAVDILEIPEDEAEDFVRDHACTAMYEPRGAGS